MIAAERPFSMASVKKEAVMISRLGSPKETLEIPSEVRLADFAAMLLEGEARGEAREGEEGKEEKSPSPQLRACSVEFVAHTRLIVQIMSGRNS